MDDATQANDEQQQQQDDEEEQSDNASRLKAELTLLHAMFPDQIAYDAASRELTYTHHDSKSCMLLRIPAQYPSDAEPEVLAAHDERGNALLGSLRDAIAELGLNEQGVEMLDEIIGAFNTLIETTAESEDEQQDESKKEHLAGDDDDDDEEPGNRNDKVETTTTTTTAAAAAAAPTTKTPTTKTTTTTIIIIWLHHLLAPSKRKQALSPPSPLVSGVSKPGYPGVLIYSGPTAEVHEHVAALKALKWQAFQVRFEEENESEEWTFRHGKGVVEVETLGEVMDEVGVGRKGVVMEALRMK